MSKSRSVSPAVSDVVGSSKMMISAPVLRALAISTSCRSPGVSLSTSVSGERARFRDSSNCLARFLAARLLMKGDFPSRGKAVDEQIVRDAEIREEVQFLVDESDAGLGRLGRVSRRVLLLPAASCRRGPAASTPPRMFISVVLPAPFSPIRPSRWPFGSANVTSCRRVNAEEALRDAVELEDGLGHQATTSRASSRVRVTSSRAASRMTAPLTTGSA